jgi:hypothetical protein
MSAAEKYARPVESMPAESLSQARAAGQALADKGVTMQAAQSVGAPTHTPAMKYAPPSANETMGRSLSQQAPGRSL